MSISPHRHPERIQKAGEEEEAQHTAADADRLVRERTATPQLEIETLRREIAALRQSEQILRENEAKYRLIADYTNDWEAWIAPDGSYGYVSPSCERITGYASSEFRADPMLMQRILHPEDRVHWNQHSWDSSVNRADPCQIDLRIVTKRGDTRWISHYCQPVVSPDGEFLGRRVSHRDITARKQAEEALRAAIAYDRGLIEASLDPLVTISAEGTISDVNAATVEATGFSRVELIGTDFSNYFTDPEKAKAGYEKVFRDGSVTDYDLEIRHRDGWTIPVLYNATVYHDASGAVAGVFAAARNIARWKKAEEERSRLAAIVDNSDDAIIGKTLDGIVASWNAGAERL